MEAHEFAQLIPPHLLAAVRVAAALIGRADAEDAVQEAIIRAWQAWGGMRERHAVRAWFLRITVHVCQAWQRGHYGTHQRMNTPIDAALPILASDADDPGTTDQVASLDLRLALDRLEEDLRQCVVLRYYAALDATEIGEILGMPPGTVRARLRRALIALQKELSDHPDQHATKGGI